MPRRKVYGKSISLYFHCINYSTVDLCFEMGKVEEGVLGASGTANECIWVLFNNLAKRLYSSHVTGVCFTEWRAPSSADAGREKNFSEDVSYNEISPGVFCYYMCSISICCWMPITIHFPGTEYFWICFSSAFKVHGFCKHFNSTPDLQMC